MSVEKVVEYEETEAIKQIRKARKITEEEIKDHKRAIREDKATLMLLDAFLSDPFSFSERKEELREAAVAQVCQCSKELPDGHVVYSVGLNMILSVLECSVSNYPRSHKPK